MEGRARVSVNVAAKELGITPTTLRSWIAKGRVGVVLPPAPGEKYNSYFIFRNEIDALKRSCCTAQEVNG